MRIIRVHYLEIEFYSVNANDRPRRLDKLVVNGVDLVNRDELSQSQQRELQRYIDANAHLLGYLDKEREEKEAAEAAQRASKYSGPMSRPPFGDFSTTQQTNAKPSYNSFSLDRAPHHQQRSFDDSSSAAYVRPPSTTQSLNRAIGAGSPYSEYGGPGKRKGVSWSDVDPSPVPTGRARSNSPPQNYYRNSGDFSDSFGTFDESGGRGGDYRHAKMARGRSPPYSAIDKQRTPYDRDSAYWSPSPWDSGSWQRRGIDGSKEREKPGWQGFAKPDLPTYSAMDRNPDDFNPFQTHLHREEAIGLRKSQERDESIKFYGYGDHRVSGIEMKPKRWQGGEIVTDPKIMQKSLKPRRLFYSPIGDGVVEADGIEMKYPPRDLTPRRYVYHQRYVEQDPGQPGLKVIENVWHEGGDGLGDDGKGAGWGPAPPADDGFGAGDKGPPEEDKRPLADDGRRPAAKIDDVPKAVMMGPLEGDGKKGPPFGDANWPNLDDGLGRGKGDGPDLDDGLGARPTSAVPSIASTGPPREPWQITFIANPRECIHIFGNEVNTNIFDLEDHTPKTITTYKETYTASANDLPALVEQEENRQK